MASFTDIIRVLPQYVLPQHTLSHLVFRLARLEYGPLKNFLIRAFIYIYNVDMNSAGKPDPADYRHFNDFFTRDLKPQSRPLTMETGTILCPVDGTVSQIGDIDNDMILQAKGHEYSLKQLLGGHDNLALRFSDGKFVTLYLSPRDYHRIHMPVTGRLKQLIHVPGRLFAVNTHTTRVVDNLFARNERVISIYETEIGPMAMIMVGAIFVGSMETVWSGRITPSRKRDITTIHYDSKTVSLKKGEEMGRFNMGSTVILLFCKDSMAWHQTMVTGRKFLMGEQLGLMGVEAGRPESSEFGVRVKTVRGQD